MYGQLLVLVIQPCCSSSLSDVHLPNLYLYFDERNNNNNYNNNNNNNKQTKM